MAKQERKSNARNRRKFRIRSRISGTSNRPRVSIFRSDKYTYVQVITDEGGETLVSGSTRDEDVQKKLSSLENENGEASKSAKSVHAARGLGMVVAEKCSAKGISEVVFDRNGFLYHGRVKAVADGLREGGLKV
ncbi:50S ribosomal protein L18 [bacterium]|nr:50S ribosomal protein L18 [bacterium]